LLQAQGGAHAAAGGAPGLWRSVAGLISIARGVRQEDGVTGRTTRVGKAVGLAGMLCALLTGCEAMSSFGSKKEAAVDPNTYPTRYRQEVSQFMRTYLNNPRNVRDAFISEPALKPVAGPPRYVSCVRYNPRGTGDQYEGITERAAIFFSGDITQFIKSTPELCGGNVVYQRFPELEKLVP
jgi:hypothetical protein